MNDQSMAVLGALQGVLFAGANGCLHWFSGHCVAF